MLRKAVFGVLIVALLLCGLVYMMGAGYLGRHEGSGQISGAALPSKVVSMESTCWTN